MSEPTPIIPREIYGKTAEHTLHKIDEALVYLADALRRGQPSYTGKIGINWIDNGNRYKSPLPVAYIYNRYGLPRSNQLSWKYLPLNAKMKSSFQINYPQVRELLVLAQKLVKLRKSITQKMGFFEMWEKTLLTQHGWIENVNSEIKALRADIELNLYERMTKSEREAARFDPLPEDVVSVEQAGERGDLTNGEVKENDDDVPLSESDRRALDKLYGIDGLVSVSESMGLSSSSTGNKSKPQAG